MNEPSAEQIDRWLQESLERSAQSVDAARVLAGGCRSERHPGRRDVDPAGHVIEEIGGERLRAPSPSSVRRLRRRRRKADRERHQSRAIQTVGLQLPFNAQRPSQGKPQQTAHRCAGDGS